MRLWLVAACCALLAPRVAAAAELQVAVSGVRSDVGTVRVAICTESTFPGGDCPYHGAAPARAGRVTVRVSDVPPGIYAVAAFHDEAGTLRPQFTLFGYPKQGFGFSRDAPMHFGPPRFADAAFSLSEAGGVVDVPLHYPPP
jgi:uncharacterized protein (DUF2141 family)